MKSTGLQGTNADRAFTLERSRIPNPSPREPAGVIR